MKPTSLICACILTLCGLAAAQTRSAPRTPTAWVAMAHDPAVPASGQATVTADFNGDGKMDLATTTGEHGGITIRLGKGDGNFMPAVTYQPRYYYNAIVAGDFNGDGKMDLAVSFPFLCGGCGGFPSYLLHVFLGAGDGTFTLVDPKLKKSFYGLPLAVGDFNGDGKLDLIVTNTDYYGDSWMPAIALGNGDGTFQKGATLTDTYYLMFPAVGDFNSDGKLDIVMPAFDSYPYGNSITSVYLGNGDGTFATPATYSSPQYWASTAAVGDFNGDGKLDIVTDGIQVLLNNGDGTFTNDANVNVAGSGSTGGVAVGDFNGDGKLDFAAGASLTASGTSYVLLGASDGTFQTVTVAGGPVLQAADFNGDGKLDLLTPNGIYLQTPASLLPTSLNFGDVPVNTVSAPQTVTLTNVGNAAMTIKSLTLTGSAEFTQTNSCGASLASGQSCTIQAVFAPTASGNVSAVISVKVPGAPPSTVTLVGYGY
jgi:FG-GAP-like repeat/Abnormal spindle-like microcephaly-assoc'd, ASPM-SPD-2-Hydin/FG-GAP repeat